MNRIVIATALLAAAAGCSKDKDKDKKTEAKSDDKQSDDTKPDDKKSDPSPTTPPPDTTAPAPAGKCEVKLEGDVQKTISLPANSGAVGTDYWTKPESLELAVKTLAGNDPEKVKMALAGDPKLFLLLINCTGDDISLSFLPGEGSKYADVPFAAKKYAIKKAPDAKAGDYTMIFSFDDGLLEPASEGVLELTKFDTTGIQGTFAFDAVTAMGEKKHTLKVTGSFDYPCNGDACTN